MELGIQGFNPRFNYWRNSEGKRAFLSLKDIEIILIDELINSIFCFWKRERVLSFYKTRKFRTLRRDY